MAEPAISLNTQDISFDYPSPAKLKQWINHVVESEGGKTKALNFILCGDDHLDSMNKKYLDHDTLTDVITFPYSEDTKKLEGDIYMSLDRIRENATELNLALEDELKRVMIHGVLHLLGYGDKTPEDKSRMTEAEDRYLKIY